MSFFLVFFWGVGQFFFCLKNDGGGRFQGRTCFLGVGCWVGCGVRESRSSHENPPKLGDLISWGSSRAWQNQRIALRIRLVCPKNPGLYLQAYDLGMGFGPSIWLDFSGGGDGILRYPIGFILAKSSRRRPGTKKANPTKRKNVVIDFVFQGYPKDHLTLQWKGLNLYCRGRVLKTASFEGSGSLGYVKYTTHGWGPEVIFQTIKKSTRLGEKKTPVFPVALGPLDCQRFIGQSDSPKSPRGRAPDAPRLPGTFTCMKTH